MNRLGSGILLHITSLPSSYGIGDFGPWAYRFVDFLSQTKQSYWQILPLNPTDPAFGNSPYHSISAFAFNSLLISPDLLVERHFLDKSDVAGIPEFHQQEIDFRTVIAYKKNLFGKAYERFKKQRRDEHYEKFCEENSHWLDDFTLFMVLKSHFQEKVWSDWPEEVRDRHPKILITLRRKLQSEIEKVKFLQYIFHQQWEFLKDYSNQKKIYIIGDIPIYVDYDSADVWSHPEMFKLDQQKKPYVVAGVPPDYFSETGQLWGNPIYRWDVLQENGYKWWIQRLEQNLKLFDTVRIDHFRGFVGYWEVPSDEKTAINGRWVDAPAVDFFNQLKKRFYHLPIIAEDLGTITPDVREVMKLFSFPGMKVLLFAFGEDDPLHPYLPHTYEKNCVVYTGTHDNNTVRGWFDREARPDEKKRLFRYLKKQTSKQEIHWELIRLAMMSVANMVIIPMQDVLGLGEEARMNRPATATNNWRWRLLSEQLTSPLAEKLLGMTELSGRAEEI